MNNTLRTGLLVLEAFWASQGPLGVSELARRLGKEKSNVHRVLVTLSAHGFVHQERATRKYCLGPGWERCLGSQSAAFASRNAGQHPDPAAWWAIES